MKINDWEKCKKIGKKGEEIVKADFLMIFKKQLLDFMTVQTVDFIEDAETQKRGIDGKIGVSKFTYDTKFRRPTNFEKVDILIEVSHNYGGKKYPGWFYKCKCDVVGYFWYNDDYSYFTEGYLINLEKFRKWFMKRKDYFETKIAHSKRGENYWSTKNKVVPIEQIPNSCICYVKGH